ncbi:hypothetical protein F4779DRAFT_638704 [Xylariaceae sp. FL0662B]|nr:hypothetical protein F4779DRAFT_638704 [Xylariaceae sp. FL0662B]
MEETPQNKFLEYLWSGVTKAQLICCQCELEIGFEDVLARTFTLQGRNTSRVRKHAEQIPVPTLSETILVYHRHLRCLLQSTKYVTVSHVWHPAVADLQYKRAESGANSAEVALIVREVPVRIYLGLAKGISQPFEVWHDYISVPQWQNDIKGKIIQAIPEIFRHADVTVAHLSDIDPVTVDDMRHGRSPQVRVRGISDLCNAKWFSRTWTAMEFVQSRRLLTMFKDYNILGNTQDQQRLLLEELTGAWSAEVRRRGDSLKVEGMAGMGKNLVPWQLGPLVGVRHSNLRGERVTFAMAYELLACRCVTNRRDFFHALLAIVDTRLTESELSTDERVAMLQVAQSCLTSGKGDYSPLFMIPESAGRRRDGAQARHGYLDLDTFILGHVVRPPTITDIQLRSGDPVFRAENIGTVCYAQREEDWGHMARFCDACRLAAAFTGLDVRAFVQAVGGRLYGQDPDKIFARLSEDNRLRLVQDALPRLHALGRGNWREDIADLVADAMGMSNTALENPVSETSPIDYLEAHGKTMHLNGSVALVGISCSCCQRRFLLRVGLLQPLSQVLGAVAYRIPGLKYYFTHEGGAGMLIKDGRMVGRFIWGTPTCDCPKLEEVEMRLSYLPVPRPNTTEYGSRGS